MKNENRIIRFYLVCLGLFYDAMPPQRFFERLRNCWK